MTPIHQIKAGEPKLDQYDVLINAGNTFAIKIESNIIRYTFANDELTEIEREPNDYEGEIVQINTNDSYYVYKAERPAESQKYNLNDLTDVTQVNIAGEPAGYLIRHGLIWRRNDGKGVETKSGKTFDVHGDNDIGATETEKHVIFSQPRQSQGQLYVFDHSGKHTL